MTRLMSTLRIHDWQALPVIERIPIPQPREGESLVRIEAAGVTHLDLTVWSGSFAMSPALPYTGGVEGAGTIVQSQRYPPGTHVAVRNSSLGLLRDGTWAEFATVPDDELVALPAALPAAIAASYFDPLATAYVTLHDIIRIGVWPQEAGAMQPVVLADEHIAVSGAAGAVGSAVIQLALLAGVRVTGLVSRPESAGHVPEGAAVAVTATDGTLEALAERQPFTALVDTVGGPSLSQRIACVQPGGRAAIVGYTAGESCQIDLPNWLLGDVALLPVNMIRHGARATQLDEKLITLVTSGAVAIQTQTVAMDQAETAVPLLRSGSVRGRLVITP